MKQWIRWSGLAGFVVICSIVAILGLFVIEPLIKYSIESFGSKAAGAKVEVGQVNLMYDPLSIEVVDVQIANADEPMENLVQFQRALADLELLPLVLGKVMVDNLILSGLEFSTPRTTSGALTKDPIALNKEEESSSNKGEKSFTDKGLDSIQKSLPTAEELLSREPLLTEQRGKAFQSQFKDSQKSIDESIRRIPDDKDLAQYETDFKRIIDGRFDSVDDFNKRKKEFDDLKKRIKKDKESIQSAKTEIAAAKKTLQKQWQDLKSAPEEDFSRLKSKYQLEGAGLGNLSRLLFGEQAGEYSKKALYLYEKVKPFLASEEDTDAANESITPERQQGRFVHFPTNRPVPDFLIANTELQLSLEAGVVDIKVTDITHQQDVINRPTLILASASNLNGDASFVLNGNLDHRADPGKESFDFILNNWMLKNYDLGAMGLKLQQGKLDVIAKGQLESGTINATVNGLFNSARFSSKDSTLAAKEMVAALAGIDQFSIDGIASGKFTKPKLLIQSDLEQKLSSAFNQRLKEKQRQLEGTLKAKLNDKLLSYAGGYEKELKALDLANGSFESKQRQLKKLSSAKMSSFKQQQEDDLKRKRDAEKKKLNEEKRKKQKELDAKKKKKQKELERKAKEKLEKLF